MNLEELLKYSKIIGTIVLLGGLIWKLSTEFGDAKVERAELKAYIQVLEAKQNIMLEERMARMERTELYNRMNEVLRMQPSSDSNYAIERYTPTTDYEQQPASKE